MRWYEKLFGGGFMMAAMVVALLQVQAAAAPAGPGAAMGTDSLEKGGAHGNWSLREPAVRKPDSRALILAQKNQTGIGQRAPSAPPPQPKLKKMRKMEAPAPAMERDGSKSLGIDDEPERAGTKKLGGEVIRNK